MWSDSARPEHVARFRREHFNIFNANKSVLSGIESVAKLMKDNRFFVVEESVDKFLEEIYQYIWDEKSGLPVKENDDVQDAVRYAIFSQHNELSKAQAVVKPRWMR
jgi:phage terminase large subunit